ncbi:hypothetical protein L226DRAFT_328008 [Lentinus tigrinus ALCF2SS1-7]|uniref:uncharacterized protein n=1 Tax=Lentinus tigrinus ALCF2SS1-7 TaxID=1328758 RepID=UPI001165D077|nr:hypothetical protein L226DRAFT_328008 [Lentinus tigrinus ALCF2SS1-7]
MCQTTQRGETERMHWALWNAIPADVGRYERTRGVPVVRCSSAYESEPSSPINFWGFVRCAAYMHERVWRTMDRASDRPIWRAYMHPQATIRMPQMFEFSCSVCVADCFALPCRAFVLTCASRPVVRCAFKCSCKFHEQHAPGCPQALSTQQGSRSRGKQGVRDSSKMGGRVR